MKGLIGILKALKQHKPVQCAVGFAGEERTEMPRREEVLEGVMRYL